MNNLRQTFSLPSGLSPLLHSNFIYLFWDIIWWGFYIGSTTAFLAIYAARCGATPGQIGLLAAIPALTSLLLSLPAGRWLRRFPAGRATVWSAFGSRILFLFYVFLPWMLPPELQVQGLIVLAVVITLPTTIINISFSQFFVEAVPIEYRGMVVGTRIALMSLVSFPVTLLCGVILTRMPFPSGYQVVFLIGFLGAILTVPVLRKVHPVAPTEPVTQPSTSIPATRVRLIPQIDDSSRTYVKIILLLFFFNMTNNMVAPLVPDLLVNTLQFPDALISLGTAISTMLVFLVSLLMARMSHRIGGRTGTGMGAVLLAVQAVLLALVTGASGYILAVIVGGLASGILSSAQYTYHLDALPPTERPSWLSWSLLLGSIAVLLGSLAGPALARLGSIQEALIVLAFFRVVIGVLIWVKG